MSAPVIGGIKRQAKSDVKPPNLPNHINNMWQEQVGVYSRRPAIEQEHPDRGNHYEFYNNHFVGDSDAPDGYTEKLYNAHKRKTWAVGTYHEGEDDEARYVFSGVIQIILKDGVEDENTKHRLLIYRGKIQPDNVSILWEPHPTYNSPFSGLDRDYAVGGCFLQYSMVLDEGVDNVQRLYVAIVLRDVEGIQATVHSVLQLFYITNLYQDDWRGDNIEGANPTWVWVDHIVIIGSVVENLLNAGDVLDTLTEDVDIEIDQAGDIHVVYGYYDISEDYRYRFYHTVYDVSEDVIADPTIIADVNEANLHGCVMVAKTPVSGVQEIIIAYLSSGSEGRIIRKIPFKNDELPDINNKENVQGSVWFRVNYLYRFGPVLAIDSDNTEVYACFYDDGRLTCQVITPAGVLMTIQNIMEPGDSDYQLYDSGGLFPEVRYTNWDLNVKDGVVHALYEIRPPDDKQTRPTYPFQMIRKSMIFNTTDSEYTNGAFGSGANSYKLIGESEVCHNSFSVYRKYTADVTKFLSYVLDKFAGESSDVFKSFSIDRGVFDGSTDVVQKQIYGYKAKQVGGEEIITVIQCEVPEGLTGDPDDPDAETRYRFYERGRFQWDLLLGQMDPGVRQIIQETQIEDKAHFIDNFGVLRAGCGIDEEQSPVWYGLINRRMYNNEVPQILQKRVFRKCLLEPPDIGAFEITSVDGVGDDDIVLNGIWIAGISHDYLDVLIEQIHADGLNAEPFFNTDALRSNISWFVWEGAPARGHFVTKVVDHPYLRLRDRRYFTLHPDEWDIETDALPFIEVFVGFAFEYDNGQVSQITTQNTPNPYKLGWDITGNDDEDFEIHYYSHLLVAMEFKRWDYIGGGVLDPRITAVHVMMGKKTDSTQTKYDVDYRLWKRIILAKDYNDELFRDNPELGDSVWAVENGDIVEGGIVSLTTKLDYGDYQRNLNAEGSDDYIGTGIPIFRYEKSYLEGYTRALYVNDRPIYMGVRINGVSKPNILTWGTDQVQFVVASIAPDLIDPAYIKPFKFDIQNGIRISERLFAIIGDNDIELGEISSDTPAWSWNETIQDRGTVAPDSIVKLAEIDAAGNAFGIFFLSKLKGGFLLNEYTSEMITNDILKDLVAGGNADGLVRLPETIKGMASLTASDAIAVYLSEYRIMLLHFPTDGITLVRDFNAEQNANETGYGSGYAWLQWVFGKNPTAIYVAPEGHMLFTNGEFIYRFPSTENDDDGVAIDWQIRYSDYPMPDNHSGELDEIGVKYKITGTTLKVTIIRNDGNQKDVSYTFPISSVDVDKKKGYAGNPVMRKFTVKLEPTSASACTGVEIYKTYVTGKALDEG